MYLQPFIIDLLGLGPAAGCIAAVVFLLWGLRTDRAEKGRLSILPLAAGLVVLMLSIPQGIGFLIPDSAEYFGAAARLLHDGTTALSIAGREIPSRYAPWFSWFFLYPLLRLTGDERLLIGLMILFSLVGIVSASFIVRALLPANRAKGAAWIGVTLLLVPTYRYFSAQVMTDLPVVALVLLVAAVFVTGSCSQRRSLSIFSVGVVVAFTAALRPLSVCALLPFLVRYRAVSAWACLLLPSMLVAGATGWYNWWVFGSPARTGYNIWTGVPYDYWWLVFSPDYLSKNIAVLVNDSFFVPALVVALLPKRLFGTHPPSTSTERDVRIFILLAVMPGVVVHLLYFYASIRFFLPFQAMVAVLAFSRLATLAPAAAIKASVALVFVGVAATALGAPAMRDSAAERSVLEAARRCAPTDALIVTSIHPVLVYEHVVRGSKRVVVPLSRTVELASKVLTFRPVPYPAGASGDAFEHRAAWLLNGEAKEVFEFVALEDLGELQHRVDTGANAVLLEFSIPTEQRAELESVFTVREICPGVQQLLPRQ